MVICPKGCETAQRSVYSVNEALLGCYKGKLVGVDAHLLELARYDVLNPVRPGMVILPDQNGIYAVIRPWQEKFSRQTWLATDELFDQFSKRCADAIQ